MFIGIYFIFVAACSFRHTTAGLAKKGDDSKIVFPGPIQELTNRFGSKNKTKHPCDGLDYCTVKPEGYPQELFNSFFKGKFKEPVYQPTLLIDTIGDRNADSDDKNGTNDCDSKVTYEPLFQARDLLGDWVTIVQAPEENFLQLVRIESCRNDGAKCFTEFLAHVDLESLCRQKTATWEVLAYEPPAGMKRHKIVLPSCCVCKYKSKYL